MINEVVAFLKRGHTLHDVRCNCCPPNTPISRMYDLGLYNMRGGKCMLSRPFNQGFSSCDISNEIGVSCIYKAVVDGITVCCMLEQSGFFVTKDSLWFLSKALMVCDISRLLSHIQKEQFGIDMDDPTIQYKQLKRDANILSVRGSIIITTNTKNGTGRMFAVRTDMTKCDDDVVQLWCDAAP